MTEAIRKALRGVEDDDGGVWYPDAVFLGGVIDYELALIYIRYDSYARGIPRRVRPYVTRILRSGEYLRCLLERRSWFGGVGDDALDTGEDARDPDDPDGSRDDAKIAAVRAAIARELELLRAIRRIRKCRRSRYVMKTLIDSVELLL